METHSSHASSDDFLREVSAVSSAEARAAKRVSDAQAEAQNVKAKAQAEAAAISAAASEKAVAEKNRLITERRHQTEMRIGTLLNKAGQKAQDLLGRRLKDAQVREIADQV
ncbi:MAG: hypothetical protein M1530_04490 [Candidatus Marsarchaeota archaeon]|nr:hypothetical protein [Candidatus Marsarchaeota archaeon]